MLTTGVFFALAALAAPIIEPEIRSWEEAEKHERLLQINPGERDSRRLLLAWYTRHYMEPRSNPARLTHILWVIEHEPDMRLSDSRSLTVDERDRASFEPVRAAWLTQVQRRPSNPIVRLRAAAALMRSDREPAATWLKTLIESAGPHAEAEYRWPPPVLPANQYWTWSYVKSAATRTLAELYTDAITGVTARTPWIGTGPVDPAISQSEFARSARREIEEAGDATLLVEAAWWLHLTSESFQRDGRGRIHYVPLAWEWLQKAEKLDNSSTALAMHMPAFQRYWSPRLPDLVPPPVPRIGLTGVDAPAPLESVDTLCPPEAERPRLGASVRAQLVIGTDGRVRFASTSGPPWAVRAALEAVRQWVFAVTYRESQAVEVETTVEIPVCRNDAQENR